MLAAEDSAPREDGPAVARDDASLRQRNDDSTAAMEQTSTTTNLPSDASPAQDSDQPPLQRQPSASSSSSMKKGKVKREAPSQPEGEGRGGGEGEGEGEGEGAPAPAPPSKEDGSDDANMAIGPSQDEIKAAPGGPDAEPVCNLTLLLAAGGRHPYKIDAKYLARRNVKIPEVDKDGKPDPFSISVYTLKELILREWRADWEAKPASPSSIRLIYFGKLLDDKNQLKAYQFSAENPNVVHMSIRPQDLDDEEPKTGNKSLPTAHGTGSGSRDGRCCVIL